MFRIKITDIKTFRDYLSAIAVLVDDATFKIEPNEFKLRDMDPSRIAMVDFAVPASFFAEYKTTENTKLSVSMTDFLKLLKRASQDETVELFLDDYSQKLQVRIIKGHERSFNMPTIDPAIEDIPTPRMTFYVTAKFTTNSIREIIADAHLVSDHVQITANAEKIILKAVGDVMGAEITLQKGTETLLDLSAKEENHATYSLAYLAEIIKTASATADIAVLEFSTDMPLKIDFQQKNAECKLTFFLAPRIEA